MSPPVSLDLTPYGTPIFLPSSGGDFTFDFYIENITDSTVVVDVWAEVTLPNGSTFGPLMIRTLTLTAGSSLSRQLTQTVPANAPSGYYVYKAKAGEHPALVYAYDSFNFAKLSDDSVPGHAYDQWNLFGWEVETVESEAPATFALQPAYPNPFNPEAHLTFTLPEAQRVSLNVYDTAGRQVATLYDGWYNAGAHHAVFSASHLPSGIYLARLNAGEFSETQKLMLVK
ncbi:T9SS type A sorting domain-containing protein [bacterium]|nr:T9SS type A sorting domain-containing protein [bacterium]MBU1650756.1 T9SS type A sorting domain-containing protein [bacterium]